MANEAVLVQQLEDRLLEVSISGAVLIEKGTILALTDANLGTACSAEGDVFLGIAATEKVAGDPSTRMAVWRHGVFDMKNGTGTISAGDMVKISGANLIAIASTDEVEEHGEIVGMALQDAAASEVIEVLVGAL